MDNELFDLELTPHQCGDMRDLIFVNNIKVAKFTKYKSLVSIPGTAFHKRGGALVRGVAVQSLFPATCLCCIVLLSVKVLLFILVHKIYSKCTN